MSTFSKTMERRGPFSPKGCMSLSLEAIWLRIRRGKHFVLMSTFFKTMRRRDHSAQKGTPPFGGRNPEPGSLQDPFCAHEHNFGILEEKRTSPLEVWSSIFRAIRLLIPAEELCAHEHKFRVRGEEGASSRERLHVLSADAIWLRPPRLRLCS